MNFNIDPNMVIDTISEALEDAGRRLAEDQFVNIVNTIEENMPDVVQRIAQNTAEYWRAKARAEGGWGTKYAEAIEYESSGNSATVFVDESKKDRSSKKPYAMFAAMMEQGVGSWSIKDALLASEKAKDGTDSDGNAIKYISIPFPVSTPRSKGQGTMQPEFGGREMSRDMYKIVKAGGRLGSGKVNVKGKDIDVSGLSKYRTPQRHSGYGIFRTVSTNSEGWLYPNKSPRPVYSQVLEKLNSNVNRILKKFCEDLVREYSS